MQPLNSSYMRLFDQHGLMEATERKMGCTGQLARLPNPNICFLHSLGHSRTQAGSWATSAPPQQRTFHNRSFREQTIAPHSAPTVEFTRSAFAQEPNVHRGWLYFRKVASPEVSLIYRSLRRRILPRQSISAL
jgi:hypothetical protein